MIDRNSFRLFCKRRGLEYSEEIWQAHYRLMMNAVARAKDKSRKTLVGAVNFKND